ncbi:MAG TPA: hypothetical protein VHY48_07170 [Acidobacteriaceae bacterium]|jgi:hypothetical protein|nr:hypothetical protein [Acidobacteriaceae bacterium]
MLPDKIENILADLSTVFTPNEILIASPDFDPQQRRTDLPMIAYRAVPDQRDWFLTAGDYFAAASQAEEHDIANVLLLGPDASSLPLSAIRQMAEVLWAGADLTVPSYSLGPHEGLVNSGLLYPITRALFANVRFPLVADAGMSKRMALRMKTIAQRHATLSQPDTVVWPVAEAAVAALAVRQIDAGSRFLRAPDVADFNALFIEVAGALFLDIEAKASFWQRTRARVMATGMQSSPVDYNDDDGELSSMVEAFRLAYNNLQEIWSLVLPPQSLLALKKLSISEPSVFSMPRELWARIVYDFALAFHLRTLNRGHLLGALTPLYLAWAASMLRSTHDQATSAAHHEETAIAFEREKPYLVSRWRWPDRFNP